jgi:hypothetical protein
VSRDPGSLQLARAVADAVLYEGYLLYPYRASSGKNQTRFQFGVLGPPGAANTGLGEPPSMTLRCVLDGAGADLVVRLRFLQLQRRQLYDGQGNPVDALTAADRTELSWDEATEHELEVPFPAAALAAGHRVVLHVDGGQDTEPLVAADGRPVGSVVRSRWPLRAELTGSVVPHGRYAVLELTAANTHAEPVTGKDAAQRVSLIGAHLLVEADGAAFVSMMDPPADAAELVAGCRQDRCWPFLTGRPGETDLLLGSPIILYDYPEIAPESPGALFDGTEIDEILTLRVMTMTDEEKAEARATDPRAREIIDRCDEMTPEGLQQLHGIFRDPHDTLGEPPVFTEPGTESAQPWWDPAADESVRPETDAVLVNGVPVAKGSLVRVHPNRRADAQDLFFADQVARVTAVLSDVDGGTHVALVLVDDPAADLHDWYGRYFYFAPDEIEPLTPDGHGDAGTSHREESRP